MTECIDVYANTNPGLCAVMVQAFVAGYHESVNRSCPIALVFLPIPLVLSSRLRVTFSGTNVNTGFYRWLARESGLTVGLAQTVEAAVPYTRAGLLFGVRYGLITIDANGTVSRGAEMVRAPQTNTELRSILSLSDRLGRWIGSVPSEQAVFHNLGLRL